MAHVWDFSVLNQRVSHMGKFFFLIIPTRPRKLELSWRRDKTVEYENSRVFHSCILILVITVIWLTLGIICISLNKLINLSWRRHKLLNVRTQKLFHIYHKYFTVLSYYVQNISPYCCKFHAKSDYFIIFE